MIKNHSDKCCNKGKTIEYVKKGTKDVQYLKIEKNTPNHENQELCQKGNNDESDNYAYISLYFVLQHFKPDIVIPINDIWGLFNTTHIRNRRCFKFMPYIAIDSECMFPKIDIPSAIKLPPVDPIQTIENADYPVVFTNWAEKVINKTAKITIKRDVKKINVIPHGVDTSVWNPISPERKKELRKQFFGINDDKTFLIGSVARNQPRKRLDAIFEVLKILKNEYESKTGKIYKAYFHCAINDKLGWPLPWLAAYYGVEDRCIFDDKIQPGGGPTEQELNDRVNCFDVHVSLTNSEGWHLPALETLAAGIPNILTDYSAHADWGKDAIYLCKVAAYEHEPKTGFIKAIASTADCAKKISLLANSKKFSNEWSQKGLKLAEKLDWDNVIKQWETLIDSVDISDLDPDRYNDEYVSNPEVPDFTLRYFPNSEENNVSQTQLR